MGEKLEMETDLKEIGGYFGMEKFRGTEYHTDMLRLNNARNALLYLFRARGIEKLYIPYFLCDSVSNMCDRFELYYEYYHIDRNFMPVVDRELDENEYLYVVNFYGQLSNETIHGLKNRFGRIIVDNVQAFFQRPVQGVDTIYSCRKFFGVPDGSYLATDVRLPVRLEQDVSMDRMKHILGRFEGSATEYYADFKRSDSTYAASELLEMSKLTQNLLRCIDYSFVCRRREENYALLNMDLREKNLLNLSVPVGPYCYPFYCENGMEIKKYLASRNIYVATLWPNVLKMDVALERDYACNILPLPCDQRYGQEDMERVIKEVKKCIS